jgi:hypothetical protein
VTAKIPAFHALGLNFVATGTIKPLTDFPAKRDVEAERRPSVM